MVVAAAALFVALPAGTAHAAGTGQVTSPDAGATLANATSVTVQVSGQNGSILNPQPHVVRVRLADLGGASQIGSAVDATCTGGDCSSDSTWTAGSFDPASMAPFGGPACNGGYQVQVQVDDGAWSGNAVRISRPPSAPRDVSVTPGTEQATVSWSAAANPDVVGYRVERRTGGGWQSVAQVGAGTRTVTDDDVAAGDVEYRVSTLRGDGLADGAPAAPCADTDPDLATASAPVATTVRAPATAPGSSTDGPTRPTPSSSPSDDGSTGGTTDDGGAGGSGDGDGGTTGDGTEAPSDGGATAADDGTTDDGAAAPARRPGNRVAPPTALGTTSRPSVSVPSGPGADAPQVADEGPERYYGDGQAFSEEIDFGDLGAVEAGDDRITTRTRVVRVPGALQSILGEELALERVLVPVAGGLIMLAFGLHLRRWTREGLDA